MSKILVVVESPKKISYISSFLGKNYIVKASCGIFRDLNPKEMSIDFDNNFEPIYITTKPEIANQLKSVAKQIDALYIASDEDREGEAIGHSVYELVKPKNYKRLRFNAINKKAVLEAIKNAGEINYNLVDAQKARRVIDRLYGYMISPLLQKKLGGSLSAGRVQSVATKIVIDRENEIKKFLEHNQDSSYFKVSGTFDKLRASLYQTTGKIPNQKDESFKGKTAHIQLTDDEDNAHENVIFLLRKALKSIFKIHSIEAKTAFRNPAPPFTTSTLQQEANRKFGMSLEATMRNAQSLYEAGFITYMRTDSVEISPEGHKEIKKVIEETYGEDYYQRNNYKNKSTTSQEAHEAIRPVHPEIDSVDDKIEDVNQIKLYKLIWQRTIASQMKPAKLNVTTIQITISKYLTEKLNPFYYFQTQIEKIVFAGFTKVYIESEDDPQDDPDINKDFNGKIPKVGDIVNMKEIIAKQEYLRPSPRYTQASLVKKLEELGIGRPSTYVNTIKTIMDREYIKGGDIAGTSKNINIFSIKSEKNKHIMEIFEEEKTIVIGKELKKLIPTELGNTVNDFLMKYFLDFLDYDFTANMETDLDKVAEGKKKWTNVVRIFYDKLNPIVEEVSKTTSVAKQTERILGTDKDGNEIIAYKSKNGPTLKKKIDNKIVYASIPKNLSLDSITLKEAIKQFDYPKILGEYADKEVFLHKGEYGLYLKYDTQNISLPKEITDPKEVDLKMAIKEIKDKKSKMLAEFTITEGTKKNKAIVLNGPYGPYIQVIRGNKKSNYPVPKSTKIDVLTNEKVLEIISTKRKPFVKNNYQGGSKKSGKKIPAKHNHNN